MEMKIIGGFPNKDRQTNFESTRYHDVNYLPFANFKENWTLKWFLNKGKNFWI